MDDVKRPFGASVRAWRHRAGISQEALAGRAGLHRTYVCDVERGTRNVSLESMEKLARALNITLSSLFAYSERDAANAGGQRQVKGIVDILYVEDSPEDVQMAMQTLNDAGIANRIRVARDGLDALQLLLPETAQAAVPPGEPPPADDYLPQVILLDLSLPKINGTEVLRRLKAHARTSAIPVVVLTASQRAADWQMCKRLGASAYIVKPLDFQNLTRVTPQLSMQWALLH